MTRTQNSFSNFVTSVASTLLVVLLNFVARSVFIQTLGTSYLGIEGIFSNLLSMLSLADLGFGTAIAYKLYKPIEENDRPRILALLRLYRQVYLVVGAVIFAVGLCLIPLLPKLIKDYDTLSALGLNAVFIFLLYLFNTASSYWFFAYKSAFVQANQKSYLLNLVGIGVTVAGAAAQIVTLLLLHSFTAYLLVQIFFSILRNLIWALVCDRRYPFVNEKTDQRIQKEERREFFKDCSALLLYRVSNVVIGGSDQLVLSTLLGTTATGLYAVYVTVKLAIDNLLYTFFKSIQASLGSLYSTGNLEWSRLAFRVVNFAAVCLYGIGAVGTAVLLDDFIRLWPGVGPAFVVTSWTHDGITVATPVAILIGVELFVTGQKYYCGTFRQAMGLFQELKYRPLASVAVNLTFSILLVPFLGIAGCVVSTIIAALSVNLIVDPLIICRKGLRQSPRKYYLRNLLYKLVVGAAGAASWYICRLVVLPGLPGFIVHGLLCVAVTGGLLTLCFFRTLEFRYLVGAARDLFHRLPGGDAAEERMPGPSPTEGSVPGNTDSED